MSRPGNSTAQQNASLMSDRGPNRLRVALVGCGEIAPDNAAGLRASMHCELGPVMDLDESVARSIGSRFGVLSTNSLQRVLDDPEVDAVVVAVPHYLHADICAQAARAGKHVIVEKPLATTLADADRMIADCASAGVALSVLFSYRYEPSVVRARALIEAGAIGEIVGTSLQFMTEKPANYWAEGYKGRVRSDWRGSWEKAGGGVLLMNTCHMIDYFRHITGLEVTRAYGEMGTLNSPVEVEDMVSATLRYAGGQIGSVQSASLARGERWRTDERIWGTHGSLVLAPNPSIYTMRRVAGLRPARWQHLKKLPPSNRVATYFDRLAQALSEGADPEVTGHDGLVNLAVILAIYEASKEGRAIEVNVHQGPEL